jgi:hypothetical protein
MELTNPKPVFSSKFSTGLSTRKMIFWLRVDKFFALQMIESVKVFLEKAGQILLALGLNGSFVFSKKPFF